MSAGIDVGVDQTLLDRGELKTRIYAVWPLPNWERLAQTGVRVLFQHPDGTFATVMTDASGVAKADMADGGSVHVIREFSTATPPGPDHGVFAPRRQGREV